MFGWIALIGNLMQIFLSVTQIPRCYCNGWEDFMPPGFHQMAAKVIGRRAWELTFDTPGRVPRFQQSMAERPYNKGSDGQ